MVLPEELSSAARNGDTMAILEWLSTGSRDPDEAEDMEGQTLLMFAAQRCQIETMRVILAYGASVHAFDLIGFYPLHHATSEGHHDAADLLLDHGAQVDARDIGGWTPLMSTTVNGNCEIIRLLLHHGADVNACDENGTTAEVDAGKNDQPKAAALLADVRRAGGWRGYVRYPRFRLVMLRIVAEQGRAETQDALLRRLFPAGPPAPGGTKRPREAYRAQKGGRLPRGIFAHILGYWRSSRDYPGPGT